jgi:hypothetical protein
MEQGQEQQQQGRDPTLPGLVGLPGTEDDEESGSFGFGNFGLAVPDPGRGQEGDIHNVSFQTEDPPQNLTTSRENLDQTVQFGVMEDAMSQSDPPVPGRKWRSRKGGSSGLRTAISGLTPDKITVNHSILVPSRIQFVIPSQHFVSIDLVWC